MGKFTTAPAPRKDETPIVDDTTTDDTTDDGSTTDTQGDPDTALTFSVMSPGSSTSVRGDGEAIMGNYVVSNESSEKVMVNKMLVNIFGDDDGNVANGIADDVMVQDHISSCWMNVLGSNSSYNTERVGVSSAGTVTFVNMDLIVPGAAKVMYTMLCDLTAGEVQSANLDLYSAVVGSVSDIQAEYTSTGKELVMSEIAFSPSTTSLNKPTDV
ncbi:hypothetical protein HQ524_04450, partial [Candidatus Uhrbacteria bacterium]|nr:hypothetical protein [Candidatus Uhrbacteria bacterium]